MDHHCEHACGLAGRAGPTRGAAPGPVDGPESAADGSAILAVRDLSVAFPAEQGQVLAVDRVSFTLYPGQTLCLVGESGCGKSMTALAVMGLNPRPGKISGGEAVFLGRNVIGLSDKAWGNLRGDKMSIIFQEPMTSLNPVFTVGDQVAETLMLHRGLSRRQALGRTAELFRQVGIPSPEQRLHDFPHQLSGGMRQRVMIAMAIACTPKLLIADEPTTALDVTIQRQILALLKNLGQDTGTATLLITHDLGVVAEMADQVAVMYAGRIVESAPAGELLAAPHHPYTQGLINCRPDIPGPNRKHRREARLPVIAGHVPALANLPSGCTFRDRCPEAMPCCGEAAPEFTALGPGHTVRCFLYTQA